jgi:rfaE bifunctional protein nucleotidyltransferase chain/domain
MITAEIKSKIVTPDELAGIIRTLKKDGKTVVQCHGVFDLLHPGHIRHFKAAKKEGDVLVVTVTRDIHVAKGPGRPVFNESLRVESIAALECVDYVAVNEWPSAVETIKKLSPDVYCKGSDYIDAKEDLTGKISEEEEAVRSVGGRIHFTDEITFSSTKLLNLHFDVLPDAAQTFLKDFRDRFSSKDVIGHLQDLRKLRVLVIGDTIIDEYHYCTPLGKSPKEILIPAKYIYGESFAGGILAIANHIAGFCEHVDVVTCLGIQNTYEQFILENLRPNISAKFFYRPNSPTIVKRRFVEADILRKLFEVHFMDGNVLPETINSQVCRYLASVTKNYDLVVVGDYGHGFLEKEIIRLICDEARYLAINVQTNSANIGFNLITNYPRADYFCIDEAEIRLATHDSNGRIENLVVRVTRELDCHRSVVTRGHKGSLVYDDKDGFLDVPVFSRDVVDRVGAGDAYLSITALCAATGLPAALLGFVGNAMGALKIRIVGNKSPVEPVHLYKYINTLLK